MEPITTAAITTLVSYLGTKIFDKSFDTVTQEFTKDGVQWLKSVFYRSDNTPKDVLIELKTQPNDEHNLQAAEIAVAKSLKDNPDAEVWLKEMVELIKAKEVKGESVRVVNSKNVNTGKVDTGGGNFIIGDSNAVNK
jgi:hypothetical protein